MVFVVPLKIKMMTCVTCITLDLFSELLIKKRIKTFDKCTISKLCKKKLMNNFLLYFLLVMFKRVGNKKNGRIILIISKPLKKQKNISQYFSDSSFKKNGSGLLQRKNRI